jgi:hypothetical protein
LIDLENVARLPLNFEVEVTFTVECSDFSFTAPVFIQEG